MIVNPLASFIDNNELDNPFKNSDDSSNVVITVEDTILNVNADILKMHSPVFNAMLSNHSKEGQQRIIELSGKRACDVIRMLRFFYTDKRTPITSKFDMYPILALCEEYKLGWLKELLQNSIIQNFDSICNVKFTSKADEMAMYYLYLAERFNIHALKENCLEYSFNLDFLHLKNYKVFQLLSKESKFFIFKYCFAVRLTKESIPIQKVSFKTVETIDEALFNYIDVIADRRCLVESAAKKIKLEIEDEVVENPLSEDSLEDDTIENPFNIANELSNLTLIVEDTELHINASVLKFYAPHLWKIISKDLSEDEKIVELKDKKAIDIINLLRFFNPVEETPLKDSSDFCSLYELCDEYQINWLKNKITNYIITRFTEICPSKDSTENFSSISVHDEMVIYFLYLAEQYNIEVLKEKCFEYTFQTFFFFLQKKRETNFKRLSRESRLLIYKYCVKRRLLASNNIEQFQHKHWIESRRRRYRVLPDKDLCTYLDQISD